MAETLAIAEPVSPDSIDYRTPPRNFEAEQGLLGAILINNRAYAEPGRTSGFNRQRSVGDFDTPEQRVGAYQDDRPWETCMTSNHMVTSGP